MTKCRVQGWFFKSKNKFLRLIALSKPIEQSQEVVRTLHLQIYNESSSDTKVTEVKDQDFKQD